MKGKKSVMFSITTFVIMLSLLYLSAYLKDKVENYDRIFYEKMAGKKLLAVYENIQNNLEKLSGSYVRNDGNKITVSTKVDSNWYNENNITKYENFINLKLAEFNPSLSINLSLNRLKTDYLSSASNFYTAPDNITYIFDPALNRTLIYNVSKTENLTFNFSIDCGRYLNIPSWGDADCPSNNCINVTIIMNNNYKVSRYVTKDVSDMDIRINLTDNSEQDGGYFMFRFIEDSTRIRYRYVDFSRICGITLTTEIIPTRLDYTIFPLNTQNNITISNSKQKVSKTNYN